MPELTPAVNNQMLPDVFTSKVLEQPRVCIVDEEQRVQLGWESSLGPRVKLFYFSSPEELLNYEKAHSFFLDSMVCIITSRLFNQKTSDIVQSDFPRQLREKTNAPIFLNWQGYIDKNELEKLYLEYPEIATFQRKSFEKRIATLQKRILSLLRQTYTKNFL